MQFNINIINAAILTSFLWQLIQEYLDEFKAEKGNLRKYYIIIKRNMTRKKKCASNRNDLTVQSHETN